MGLNLFAGAILSKRIPGPFARDSRLGTNISEKHLAEKSYQRVKAPNQSIP